MNILITGAAGNLGSFLAKRLVESPHHLRLMFHHREPPDDISVRPNTSLYHADLGQIGSLTDACLGTDCIVHFAGKLFAPQPEKFLPQTNVIYVENLVSEALSSGVKKFILISFPHVEGETNLQNPARGLMNGKPESVHARTRLEAEKRLFAACQNTPMTAVALRAGMIYGREVLMIEAARWLLKRRLLGVWRKPTWIHLIALPDFLCCLEAAIEIEGAAGVYNLGDDRPVTLQQFLDRAALHWGHPKPWRAPELSFYIAAGCVEAYAALFRKQAPLTRDFIKIGMASYVMDTSRTKRELHPTMLYPSLDEGVVLL
jgi:nucleoside-diphosphate-sugar epimerase